MESLLPSPVCWNKFRLSKHYAWPDFTITSSRKSLKKMVSSLSWLQHPCILNRKDHKPLKSIWTDSTHRGKNCSSHYSKTSPHLLDDYPTIILQFRLVNAHKIPPALKEFICLEYGISNWFCIRCDFEGRSVAANCAAGKSLIEISIAAAGIPGSHGVWMTFQP